MICFCRRVVQKPRKYVSSDDDDDDHAYSVESSSRSFSPNIILVSSKKSALSKSADVSS